MSFYILSFLALLTGVCATLQSAANGGLSRVSDTTSAVSINTAVFTLVFVVYFLIQYFRGQGSFSGLGDTGWPQYLGGAFGFGIVLFSTVCFPRIGALWSIALMVLGQCVSALLVEQSGIWGMQKIPISLTRVLAIFLIVGGIALLKIR